MYGWKEGISSLCYPNLSDWQEMSSLCQEESHIPDAQMLQCGHYRSSAGSGAPRKESKMARRLVYVSILFALLTVAALGGWHMISTQGNLLRSHAARAASVSAVNSTASMCQLPAMSRGSLPEAAIPC